MVTRDFVMAGKAIFTVSNGDERYTYRVTRKESTNPRFPNDTFFIGYLAGSDNTSSYSYLGVVTEAGEVKLTKASKAAADSKVAKVAAWALRQVWSQAALPAGYEIMHAGRCGRCGRLLTVPESIETGLGPECITKAA